MPRNCKFQILLGVSKALKGVFVIGVVRAPVAMINFAFFVRELLVESYINSEIFGGTRREIKHCNRCARERERERPQ